MTERERMKERKQRMIKIAAAAVATCMYTCMSGHRRCLATLTHTYQTRPRVWHALISCSLSPWTNVQRYLNSSPPNVQRKSNCCRESPPPSPFLFSLFTDGLLSYLFRWTLIPSQHITLIKLSKNVNSPSNFCRDVKIKSFFFFFLLSSTASSLWI